MKSPRTIIIKAFKDMELAYRRLWDDVYNIFTLNGDSGTSGEIIKSNGAGSDPEWVTPTVDVPVSFETYDAEPARTSEGNQHGGLKLLTAGTELSPTATQLGPATPANDISVSKGIGKILIVVVAGSDVNGTITVTGEKIDRNTGASTPGHTNTITVDALTTNNSTAGGKGSAAAQHAFEGAYITDDWFTGTVVLSTSTLNVTVYVYHVSFEQFNDKPNLTIDTFDVNLFSTNANAEFDAYLYTLKTTTGNKCDITRIASIALGTDGETAIANKYWRLRRGNLAVSIDGTTDGVWVDSFYLNSPSYIEDVSLKVWATETVSLTLT